MSTNIGLADFQRHKVNELLEFMEDGGRDAVLRSPTGSGKTIMLTHFMNEYLKEHPRTIFVWLTPGKGNLEEQSKEKMDRYIHGAKTKLLKDVMTSGFEEGDCCFINWEKLTKKDNTALKDSEHDNFRDKIQSALDRNLCFKVIIDESHQNFTEKADAVVKYFKTDKIVRSSATPLVERNARLIDVKEQDVIDEGLIKKLIVINEDFKNEDQVNDEIGYLLGKALLKQSQLSELFSKENSKVNPLIIVQLPNNSDALLEKVEEFFKNNDITYDEDNRKLAVWLANLHENCEGIEKNGAPQVAVIIKQAIATGWDCPRAHILVKLRSNMNEIFEIQTIGRIRRMPEARHYGNDALDSCYIYTYDKEFVAGVKSELSEGAFEAKNLWLKDEYKSFSLIKEQRTMVVDTRDPRKAFEAIRLHFEKTFSLHPGDKEALQNQKSLRDNGFIFSDKIERYTISGETSTMAALQEDDIENRRDIVLHVALGTHDAGRLLQHSASKIGSEIGMNYDDIKTILFRLFCEKYAYRGRFLSLSVPLMYLFVINNEDCLRWNCREAMSEDLGLDPTLSLKNVSEREFRIPQSTLFTYDASRGRELLVSQKNVYDGYLYATKPRSVSERDFEEFCEEYDKVDWIYKNGDKGDQYFSIAFQDNYRQKLFYPDYIVSVNGTIWIIEAKGVFASSGESEDIKPGDSTQKFNALKEYLRKHPGLRGGFVRYNEDSRKLLIATERYDDDVNSDAWKPLKREFDKDFGSNVVEYDSKKDSTVSISPQTVEPQLEAAEDETEPYGVDVNANDLTGNTALMIASMTCDIDRVKSLLDKGEENVDAQNDEGYTALMLATSNGHSNIVKILVKYKANVNAMAKNGDTALSIAKKKKYTDIEMFLSFNGARK